MSRKTASIPKRVPKLRFPEFQDAPEWEEEKFSNLYSLKATNTLSRDKLNYESGTVKNIHYGDIHTKFSTIFRIEQEDVPFINPSEPTQSIKQDSYCKIGDMVFADASEDLDDVGKSIEITSLNGERVVSGLHTILARQKGKKLIVGFGGHLFKSELLRKQIQREAQGAKVLGISGGRLSNIDVCFPDDTAEQQRIADCLSSLDEWIAAETQRLDALKDHKKGLMQKLFPDGNKSEKLEVRSEKVKQGESLSPRNAHFSLPPLRASASPRESIAEQEELTRRRGDAERSMKETTHDNPKRIPKLRFPEFQNAPEWEERVLEDVSDQVSRRISISLLTLENYISTENILPDFGGVKLSSGLPTVNTVTRYRKNDVLIANIRPYLRKVWLSDKEGGASNDVIVFRPKNIDAIFHALVLKTDNFINFVMKDAKGVKMPRGDTASMKSFPFPLPSLPEQQRIADCLSSLDELITAQSAKIDALKEHKKGLMQQLFPVGEQK